MLQGGDSLKRRTEEHLAEGVGRRSTSLKASEGDEESA